MCAFEIDVEDIAEADRYLRERYLETMRLCEDCEAYAMIERLEARVKELERLMEQDRERSCMGW